MLYIKMVRVVLFLLLGIHVSESSFGWIAPCFSSLLEYGGLQLRSDNGGFKEKSSGDSVPLASEQRVSRLKAPLNKAKPKTGMQRRISIGSRDAVHFYLYPDPLDTTYKEEIVVGNNASLSRYNKNYYPIILIHGYMQNYTSRYPQRTKDAYLRNVTRANVILVDWQGLAESRLGLFSNIAVIGYPKASRQVSKISKQISEMIMFLVTEGALQHPSSVHIVGFGLGAQIAGVTGSNFKRTTGLPVGRITGLDPSGLQYHYTALSEKLDKSDASFVDVIHTTTSPFGMASSIGHVDFYPNGGGPGQPGCESIMDMMKGIPGIQMEGSCAHAKAWEFFTDSIYNTKLYACQASSFLLYKMKSFCSKPVVFGESVPHTARGDYFLELFHKKQQ